MANVKAPKKGLDRIDRRGKIVEAALAAFIANGIGPTTMRDVAKRAKVDPPLIHYYFKDIESLHLAVIGLALADLKDYSLRVADTLTHDPKAWMREYLKAPLIWIQEKRELMFLWVYFYTLACRPGAFRDLNNQIRKGGRERITFMVFRGIESGVFKLPPGLTTDDAALEIQSWMSGAGIVFASEDGVDYQRVVRLLEQRVFNLLGCSDPI